MLLRDGAVELLERRGEMGARDKAVHAERAVPARGHADRPARQRRGRQGARAQAAKTSDQGGGREDGASTGRALLHRVLRPHEHEREASVRHGHHHLLSAVEAQEEPLQEAALWLDSSNRNVQLIRIRKIKCFF